MAVRGWTVVDRSQDNPGTVHIETATGDNFFVALTQAEPEIPDGLGRECPQCGRLAWARSRWCWHCRFDFDRAALARFHPSKLLFISTLTNAALCVMLGILIYTAHSA